MSGVPRSLKDGVLTVYDGSGSPKSLEIGLDQGELKWDRKAPTVNPVRNRTRIVQVRTGLEQMHDVEFKVAYDFLSADSTVSGAAPSLSEALHGDGFAEQEGWTGTDAARGSDYCTKLVYEITAPAGSQEMSETVTLEHFFVESFAPAEGEAANMIQVKGRCINITTERHS